MRVRTLLLVGALGGAVFAAVKVGQQQNLGREPTASASAPQDVTAPNAVRPTGDDPAIAQARNAAALAHKDGRFEDALTILATARKTHPEHPGLRTDFITVAHNAAVAALGDGRYALALRFLARAEVVAKGDAAQLVKLGKVSAEVHMRQAREADDDAQKRPHLEAALAADADRGDAYRDLAKVCERENDLDCAVKALTALKGTHQGAHIKGLDTAIARLEKARAVEGDFSATENNQFVVRFEGYAQERLAYNVLDGLSHAYYRVNEKIGRTPERRITVVLYTGGQYKKALGAPDWSSGFYDGKIRVREGDAQRESGTLTGLLAHEYTHALLRETVRAPLPGWFHEGLARHMEPGRTPAHATQICARANAAGPLLPLSTLVQPLSKIADGRQAALGYAMAESMLALLIDKQGFTGIQKLLDATHEGSGTDAFSAAFAATYFVAPDAFFSTWQDAL